MPREVNPDFTNTKPNKRLSLRINNDFKGFEVGEVGEEVILEAKEVVVASLITTISIDNKQTLKTPQKIQPLK